MRATETTVLPKDEKWPFLLRFHTCSRSCSTLRRCGGSSTTRSAPTSSRRRAPGGDEGAPRRLVCAHDAMAEAAASWSGKRGCHDWGRRQRRSWSRPWDAAGLDGVLAAAASLPLPRPLQPATRMLTVAALPPPVRRRLPDLLLSPPPVASSPQRRPSPAERSEREREKRKEMRWHPDMWGPRGVPR
uniref:Uncharacterized protein n=1 Tax=Oryza rufipogon TaxID=4529 RepID=A0A0E0P5Y5_ORYRU